MDDGRMAVDLVRVRGERERFVPWLLEADESEPILRSYLDDGELYEVRGDHRAIGVCLLLSAGDEMEIKNIALDETARGRGNGRAAISEIAGLARSRGMRRLLVGTADTSAGTIAFYRRVGFHEAGIRHGFFDGYPEPVVEDGRVAHDMLLFAIDLRPAP
jgi:ribosomal protein S18 acetylase RimI-like enzyme